MDEWATADYEPTSDEIAEFVERWLDIEPGHGNGTVIPVLWSYLLTIPGVFVGDRRENEDGTISFEWFVPEFKSHH